MLPIAGLVFGFILGWARAARRGGSRADRIQFAIGHALAFGLGAFIAAIAILRSGLFG